MSQLKMGVIGVGALGRHHARILAGLDGVELVAVADSSPERGKPVAEAAGCEWIADYRELLDKVEAVSVAVPTFAHKEVAIECIQRGIPMMMEKPLAGNLADAREIAELADEKGVTLQVGHIERFNPATITARALCGEPKYLRSTRTSPFPFRSMDISVIHDVMIHDLDLILEMTQSHPEHVEAFGVTLFGTHEDCVQAHVVFENGCVADITASRLAPEFTRSLQIWSSTGCVAVDFNARQVKRYRPGAELLRGPSPVDRAMQPGANIDELKQQVFGSFIEIDEPEIPAADALTAELAHFANCVKTGKTPDCDGWKAVAALDLADRIQRSVRTHAWGRGQVGPNVLPMDVPLRRAA